MDKVVHFEIPMDDVGRAQKFYQEIFGWQIKAVPEMDYVLVHTGPTDNQNGMTKESGFINGGMMKRQKLVRNPVITISVEDIDKTAKQIETSGGKIVEEKQQVGDMGFAAYFEDSEGNILGLWQPNRQ